MNEIPKRRENYPPPAGVVGVRPPLPHASTRRGALPPIVEQRGSAGAARPASSSRRTIVSRVAPPQRWASRSLACSQTGARRPQSLFARRWVEARLGAYWREAEGA